MNEERLWAPWRLDYIAGNENPSAPPEPTTWLPNSDRQCFLCRAAAIFSADQPADRELLVVERGDLSIAVLNRFPYSNGHLLLSPRRHVADLAAMSREEHAECCEQLTKYVEIYRDVIRAEGFNIGLNLGRVAGAGVPGHLHWHLVPRWPGDNNFMPVTAGTRVIPQSLDTLWQVLTDSLKKTQG